MKLELKHLVGYLPYVLNCLAQGEGKKVFDMQGITDLTDVDLHEIGRTVNEQYDIEDVFPILRPLSDLTKEIEVNGEKFVPIKEYSYLRFEEISTFKGGCSAMKFIQARELELLYEMHFDIYGLIEADLAIDINTLNS